MVTTSKTNTESPSARKAKRESPSGVLREAMKLVNERDLDALHRVYAQDLVYEVVPLGVFHGAGAVIEYLHGMLAAVPDFHIEEERIVSGRGTVFVKWRATGTFSGAAFHGIEPTGRRIELRGIDCATVKDGVLVENTVVYDGAEFSRQIGMLPPAGSRGERAMIGAFNGFTRARRRFAR